MILRASGALGRCNFLYRSTATTADGGRRVFSGKGVDKQVVKIFKDYLTYTKTMIHYHGLVDLLMRGARMGLNSFAHS